MDYLIFNTATRKIERTLSTPGLPSPGSGYDYIAWPVDGSGKLVTLQPGDTVNAEKTLVPYTPSLADGQAAKLAAANAYFQAKIAGGYTHTDGHVYQLGPDALGSTGMFNLSAIAQLCQRSIAGDTTAWPSGSFIRDASNNNVVYSASDALTVCTNAGEYVDALRKNYWSITASISAATTQATLDAIDVTTGYPT